MKKHQLALIVCLFVLSLACSGIPGMGGAATGDSPSGPGGVSEGDQPADDSGPSESGTVKAGEAFKNGWFRIVVLGWTEFEPTEVLKPGTGNRIISVDITAVNLGKDLHQLVENNFSIKDSESREYNDYVFLSTETVGYENCNIFPGQRWTGSFGFEVPKDSTGFTLVMAEDPYDKFNRVLVELDSEPGLVEPPPAIEGEKAPEIHPAGEAAACGSWSIQADAAQMADISDMYRNMMPSGFEILLVELTLKNTGFSGQSIDQVSTIWLQVPSGRRYGESFIAQMVARDQVQGAFFESNNKIAAGEKIRGWLGFSVPQAVADPFLVFWCGAADSSDSVEKVEIALPR